MFHTSEDAPPARVRKSTPRKQPNDQKRYVPFRERPFIAWDGEGEHPDNVAGNYLLFGCSKGETISSRHLRATECFELMCNVAARYPNHIHFAFAFDYDVAMICASLPARRREQLVRDGVTWFNHYRIEYRPKKWFVVRDRERNINIRIYDIFTFFACSALQAWGEYLPDEPVLAEVVAGKDNRSSFTFDQMPMIKRYMQLELELYVKLATKLRLLLSEMEVFPASWHGPGAVAGAVLRKFGIKHAMDKALPDSVIVASQHAYFGGRFEQFHAGRYDGTIYAYDIRSAYPHALRHVPSLQHGFWHHDAKPVRKSYSDFSLCRVFYRKRQTASGLFTPSPFPLRDVRHCIHYSNELTGWYWGVEVNAAIAGLQSGDELVVSEVWDFIEETPVKRPFAFIEDLFIQRQNWKNEGNPVQLAAKLVLNSMYGKLAQRVGGTVEKGPPSWHQLEYAGFATAYCRAMMYRAISQNPHAIIAVETDGLFSTVPLDLGVDTKQLGDWECDEYDGIIYVQSGMYWLRRGDEYKKVRVRGFGPGDVQLSTVLDSLDSLSPVTAHTHRFAGIKAFWNKPQLTQWIDKNPVAMWGGGGKRHHNDELCPKCLGDDSLAMHPLTISRPFGGDSYRHVLPWRDTETNPFWEKPSDNSLIRLSALS